MLPRMLHTPMRTHAAALASSRAVTFIRRAAVDECRCRCRCTLAAAAATGGTTVTSTARRSFSSGASAAATQPAAAHRINDMEDGNVVMRVDSFRTSAPHVAATASAAAAATGSPVAPSTPPLPSHCARPLVVFDLPGARPYDEVWRWQQRFVRDKVAAERRLKRVQKEAAAAALAQPLDDAQQPADAPTHPELSAAAAALDTSESALSAGLADVLLMLEHAPVFTLGRNASLRHLRFPSHVRVRVAERGDLSAAERQRNGDAQHDGGGVDDDGGAAADFELLRVERGGEVTFHGPGQLILYPLLALNPTPIAAPNSSGSVDGLTLAPPSASPYRADLHWFLRGLESVVMRLLRLYHIEAERIEGASGVWVRMHTDRAEGSEPGSAQAPAPVAAAGAAASSSSPSSPLRKICAVGLSCSGWVSMHGCALNVDADLGPFAFIVPCGLDDAAKYGGVTSMREVIAQRTRSSGGQAAEVRLDHALIRRQLLQCFCDEFGLPQPAAVLTEPPAWHTNSDTNTSNGQP